MHQTFVSRRGLALPALLAALAFALALAGLLLPAVQKARAAAARTACENNLKRLGSACLGYESAHGRYPYTLPSRFNEGGGRGWMPLILPHLEQHALADRFRFDRDWSDQANAGALNTPVPAFVCPAAPTDARVLSTERYGAALWPYPKTATTDYLGIGGILMTLRGTEWVAPGLDPVGCGAIGTGKGWQRGDFPDGLATTLLASEGAGRPYIWRAGKRSPTDHNPTILPERPNLSGAWAAQNVTGYRSFSPDGVQLPGTCPLNCSNWIGGLYSFHAGGAGGMFADGSVRFLHQNMNVFVAYGLMSRAGGELIGPDDY